MRRCRSFYRSSRLVLAGFICRRTGILGPAALTELNRFVVWLGLPALFLKITVHASWDELYQPGFMVVFGLSCFILFFATILIRMRKKGLADASVEGLDAAYPNAGYMGFPLCFLVFGADSFPVVTIAAITTACVMFAVAIVLLEIGIQTERHSGRMALAVTRSLIKNPLVVSPAIGIAFCGLWPAAARSRGHLPRSPERGRQSVRARRSWALPRG